MFSTENSFLFSSLKTFFCFPAKTRAFSAIRKTFSCFPEKTFFCFENSFLFSSLKTIFCFPAKTRAFSAIRKTFSCFPEKTFFCFENSFLFSSLLWQLTFLKTLNDISISFFKAAHPTRRTRPHTCAATGRNASVHSLGPWKNSMQMQSPPSAHTG